MARPKEDLSKLSINQLHELTGAVHRTISKYLKEAGLEPEEETDNAKLYNPREALPVIFEKMGYNTKSKELQIPAELTPEQEASMAKSLLPGVQKARKDRAQANKAEFELEVLMRKYIPAEEIDAVWSVILTAFRLKTMAQPAAETPTLFRIKNIKDFQEAWEQLNRNLLQELSNYDIQNLSDDEDGSGESSEESGPSA